MSIAAFSGGAGCGKTFSVMGQLRAELEPRPLLAHQRVLALTYMHGARHRLDEQLEEIDLLRGRYEASTIDSFAWTICRRWRSRAREYGLNAPALDQPDAFNEVCRQAGRLLADEDVQKWVATSYPYVLVDEAQDLDQPRLLLVEGLLTQCCVLLAFDEFQCLNSRNRPVAVEAWIAGRCQPTVLVGNQRTNVDELLQVALQLRESQPLTVDGRSFKFQVAPARRNVGPVLAATLVAFRMRNAQGSFALLSPCQPDRSPYVRDIVELVRTRALGNNPPVGPFNLRWEGGQQDGTQGIRRHLQANEVHSYEAVLTLLSGTNGVAAATLTLQTVRRLYEARGTREFTSQFLISTLDRHLARAGQFSRRSNARRRALTIHQAKNREFDHVVVLWPYSIPPDADDRRRLLYNAITRARQSCLVLIQSEPLRQQAPFI
jgi:hypothetical protein